MSPPAQEVSFSRLMLVVTGSIGAAYLPAWLIWLSRKHPELELRIVLTRSAERFITRTTIHASSGAEVEIDTWEDEEVAEARHVRWAQWAEAIMVYPASMHYLARLATGLADTPSLLAAHCTRAPILVAPGLPPGAVEGPVYASHVRALKARGNVDVIAPIMANRDGLFLQPIYFPIVEYGRQRNNVAVDAFVSAPTYKLPNRPVEPMYLDVSSTWTGGPPSDGRRISPAITWSLTRKTFSPVWISDS